MGSGDNPFGASVLNFSCWVVYANGEKPGRSRKVHLKGMPSVELGPSIQVADGSHQKKCAERYP